MRTITANRERVYQAIITLTAEKGYPPSIREIQQITGILSTATVSYHLRRLESQGRITYQPGLPRTIVVIGPLPVVSQ